MLFIDINVVGETVAGFLLLPAGGAAGGPGGGSEEEADYRGDAGQQPAEVVGDAARRWAWNPLGVATDEERRFPPPAAGLFVALRRGDPHPLEWIGVALEREARYPHLLGDSLARGHLGGQRADAADDREIVLQMVVDPDQGRGHEHVELPVVIGPHLLPPRGVVDGDAGGPAGDALDRDEVATVGGKPFFGRID